MHLHKLDIPHSTYLKGKYVSFKAGSPVISFFQNSGEEQHGQMPRDDFSVKQIMTGVLTACQINRSTQGQIAS